MEVGLISVKKFLLIVSRLCHIVAIELVVALVHQKITNFYPDGYFYENNV